MKIPKCKYCGEEGHYAFQCYKKARAEYALKCKITPLRRDLKSRTGKLPSRKQSTRKRLINELDKLTSELVRKSQADKNGLVYCYTCGVRKPWQEMDCGHYRSRRFMQTRFDLDNVKIQCKNCNRYKHGNLAAYRQKLIRELGEQKVQEIETRPSKKFTEAELEQLVEQRRKGIDNIPKNI